MLRFALPRYRPRYIAVTYLVTDPTPTRASDPPFFRSLACVEKLQASWCSGGALCVLRFALARYRPRYIAVTYLVTDPIPSPGQRPCFLPQLGLR